MPLADSRDPNENDPSPQRLRDAAELWMLRLAAGGFLPAGWFSPIPPADENRAARTGHLRIEIVSHCWRYAHLLVYQLSSLVLFPPTRADVTMTVFHAADDERTVRMLEYFGAMDVPGLTWNWQVLDTGRLFRRAIGRNLAARASVCDWVWFTDCDVVFHAGCLDGLVDALQGRREALVFPREEHCSPMLESSDVMLEAGHGAPRILDIDTTRFSAKVRDRATGPLQIAHGDVARACGYCSGLRIYQKPSAHWAKAHEDRAFRWLLRTQGTPLDVPAVYRIRHVGKGRYQGSRAGNFMRTAIRRLQTRWREKASG